MFEYVLLFAVFFWLAKRFHEVLALAQQRWERQAGAELETLPQTGRVLHAEHTPAA